MTLLAFDKKLLALGSGTESMALVGMGEFDDVSKNHKVILLFHRIFELYFIQCIYI